jgi:hypothetical protein
MQVESGTEESEDAGLEAFDLSSPRLLLSFTRRCGSFSRLLAELRLIEHM